MAFVPSSPKYTPSTRYAIVGDPRWIALCGYLRGKSVSHLRAMVQSSFDQLEADLGCDPDFPVMRAALEKFFYWTDFMDLFAQEMRGWLTQVTRRLTTDAANRKYIDRRSVPQAERASAALRVALGSGLVRTLEDQHQVLDHAVALLDEALWAARAVGLHYQDLETSLSDCLDTLEALSPF
ncbi:hypothetical protein LIER_09082 [Lithospermum erythrorhizon]|uniref:Uncharacterized protein n=1 Tax=Lithospermum erythrorhizon TaxID=34254 RepID=A0AAV3PG20_LITER